MGRAGILHLVVVVVRQKWWDLGVGNFIIPTIPRGLLLVEESAGTESNGMRTIASSK
jgi:hypothetical protein